MNLGNKNNPLLMMMKFNFTRIIALILFGLMGLTSISFGQTIPLLSIEPISFDEFLQRIGTHNLEYHAELLELDKVLAEEESAKVFGDPILSFAATDNSEKRMNMGYEYESALEWTLELGGKRKARMKVANSEVNLTRILLADFFSALRIKATLKFLEAIKEKSVYDIKSKAYESMNELAISDSIRFELGDITEIDAKQSRVEAALLLNELIQQKADWENAVFEVNRLMGEYTLEIMYEPILQRHELERTYQLEDLLPLAQENRMDLKAALQNKQISKDLIKLIKAERTLDVDLSIGFGHNTVVTNEEAFTPAFTSITAGIAIPLKFSNRNKGKLKAAQYELSQSEILHQNTKMGIKFEVYQAYSQFQAGKKQIKQFDSLLLQNAERILRGKVYSYQRGETSLLEVLNAQRTHNEIQENYHESLFAYASSLIHLQQVVGIWDIHGF